MSPKEKTPRSARPQSPRGRLRRRLLKAAAAIVVLMVIAALYLQSSHAFAHLWLPIVARAVDGEIAVERGKISLLGKISLEGLVFTDGQGRGVFRADSLFVHCSLLSLISGSVPLLRSIELQNPDLVALFALGGGSKESGDDGDGEGKPSRWEGPLLPVGIQRLVVRGLSFRWVDGEETRVAVSNGEITIDGLVHGEIGTLTIEGELAVAPDDPARARSGRFDLTLSIEQNEDGSELKWNGAGSAIARDVSADASASGTSDLRFDSKFEGSLSGLDSLASIASLAASQDGTQVGGIKTSLQWSSRGVQDGPSLDAKIEIEAIRPEFLNPLLAALGPAQLESAKLDGVIVVQLAGDELHVELTMDGETLSLRSGPDQPPTPPLNFHTAQSGSWNQAADEVTIAKAEINLTQAGRPDSLIDVTLDRSVTIKLGDESAAAGAQQPAPEALLTARLNRFSVEDLRPWLAVVDSHGLDSVLSAVVKGELGLRILSAGQRIEFEGDLQIEDLSIEREDAPSLGPIEITTRIEGAIQDLAKLSLNSSTVTVSKENVSLAEISASGSYDLEELTADLTLEILAADLSGTLDRLGLTEAIPLVTIQGGSLRADANIVRKGVDSGFVLTGALGVQDITLVSEKGRRLQRSLDVRWSLESNAEQTRVAISEIALNLLEPGGSAAGSLTVQGEWPIASGDSTGAGSEAASAQGGKAEVRLRGLDGGPWINFFGWIEGKEVGHTPIEADITIEVDAAGERFVFEGEERIGPVQLASGDEASEEVALTIQNRFEKLGEKIENVVVDFTGKRETGADDKIHLEGSATLGETPSVTLRGVIESFNASIYTAQLSGLSSSPGSEDAAPPPDVSSPASEQGGAPDSLPLDLDIVLELGKIAWREIRIEGGMARVSSDRDTLHATIEKLNVSQGTLDAQFDLTLDSGEPRYVWNVTGLGIQAGPFVGSLQPKLRGQIEGTAAFSSQGTARGSGEALKNQVEGSLVFDLTDGRFGESRLMTLIAERTKLDVFDRMAFARLHGEIALGGGWAELRDVRAIGTAAQIVVDGRVGLGGELDLAVHPRVGPPLNRRITGNRYIGALLNAADGFTDFPFAITVKGTIQDPSYGVGLEAPSAVEKLGDAIRSLIPRNLLRRD